jgi:hypothetical protein
MPGVAVRVGARRTWLRVVYERIDSFLAAGNLAMDRAFLVVRPAIAALIIVAVVLPSDLPGRQGVIIGCLCAITYNFGLAFLYAKRRLYWMRAISTVFDELTIVTASLWVFYRMGNAGYESDLWLAYLTFIITSAFSYGPLGSLFFAAVWTGLFMLSSLEFYDAGTHTREQLPMRLTFFVLVSFCMVALSAELRKQREKLEHQSRETLSMLATIVEARDTDAGRHLKRITHYSRALALSLGLSEVRANEIAYAAMIHDVGKAQVPDAILKKPGPLTAEERREIEKHTVWGYDLLSENEEFRAACEVARSHHERWDGTGYPDSVRSEDIPIAARITAVADVYDALTSERPYKHAWSSAQAIAEITRLSGTHFDPQVVAAFLELHQSGILRAIDDGMRAGDTPAPADDLLAA